MTSLPTEIVYFAVNRWDSMVQREQHLMMGLSSTYRILFVDPPLSLLSILSGKIQGEKWTLRSNLYWVNDQLVVYTPPAFPPLSQYFEWMNSVHNHLLISLIKKNLEKLSFKNFMLGVGRPFLGCAIKEFGPKLSYYDCSDEYLEFPGLRANKRILRKSEEELLRGVDVVFCSSEGLKETKSRFNRNCFLLPNGVDLSLIDSGSSNILPPADIKKITRPILGYIGTIGEWLDFNALIGLARARTDWSIVMVGPLTEKHFSSFFKDVPNIYWLGGKDYRELYPYLKMFDVCLIPFKVNEFTKNIYPTKLHQYLAAGKQVISSHLPDLESFTPWVEFYSDVKDMEMKIERSLQENSEEKILGRKKIARENTWDRRVVSMIQTFNTFFSKEIPSN